MKTLYVLLLCLPFMTATPAIAQRQSKEEKAARLEKEFKTTLALVESNHFRIEINRAYPQSGRDLSRFNPRGHINISDSTAQGQLPFFGRAYSLPYGEGGGIEFDAPMQNRKISTESRKRKKSILYRFSVPGKNDTYQISIEISPGGSCSVNVNSNNRAHISFTGNISPLKEAEGQK